jgi:hypothetical protein
MQNEQLYVSDPQALQTIILKEQDAFEETSVFLEYDVLSLTTEPGTNIPQPRTFQD